MCRGLPACRSPDRMITVVAGGTHLVAMTLEAWRPRPSTWRNEDEFVGLDPFGGLAGESRDDRPDADPGIGCLMAVGHEVYPPNGGFRYVKPCSTPGVNLIPPKYPNGKSQSAEREFIKVYLCEVRRVSEAPENGHEIR